MTPRPHVLDDCWCGQGHHDEIRGDGDDLRVRPPDSRAELQAGLNGPSGSLNPSPRRAPGRMEQDEFNSRLDAGEDPYSIVADDRARSAASPRLTAIKRALEGVGALNDRASNPDGYCACMGDAKCFLHGVTVPEGITAAESLLAELKGASRV